MRCYNAAMSERPWQFSIRRMFAATTIFCIAAFGVALAIERHGFGLRLCAWLTAGAAFGTGIGLFLRRPILCALICTLAFAILAVPSIYHFMTNFQQMWLIKHGLPQDPGFPPLGDP
jgi:hypothetical protein